jgi:hypothetical protein
MDTVCSKIIFRFSCESGQGASEGKRALYHCNYCNKDITGKIRIKCAMCPDFDLCIECFSVGAEVQPHKSNHPYRVMVSKPFDRDIGYAVIFLLSYIDYSETFFYRMWSSIHHI